MRRALLLLVVVATVLATSACGGSAEGPDARRMVHWLDERPDVASVEKRDDRVVVRLDEGRSDEQVWDFVDAFQEYADDVDDRGDYRLDVDGFDAFLSTVPLGGRTRTEAQGDLVRALWFRADGRATRVTDGASVSVSTLVTAPAADVVPLVLDLQEIGVDTGDSIRVQAPDGSMGVQWSTRADFDVDLAVVRSMAALQEDYPGTRGWVNGVAGATRVGVVFSPDDIALDRLRAQSGRLVPWLDRDRDALGWGTLVTSPRDLRAQTREPATRAAYAALAEVPGLVPSRYVDAVATDLDSLRAARRVLRAHPDAGLRSVGYGPVPSTSLGEDRDLVLETTLASPAALVAAQDTVTELPAVLELAPSQGRLVVAAAIDDGALRTALETLAGLLDPQASVTVTVAAARTGFRRVVGSTTIDPEGVAERGDAVRGERRDDALLERIETTWADLSG